MKKHALAVAVSAALAAPAMAQQVSVYGLIDAGVATSKITHDANLSTKQKATGGLHSANGTGTLNGSRLGFRGTEDLGGGLRAGFVFELGINYSPGQAATTEPTPNDATILGANAAGMGNVRQGFLELAGGFGGVRIGTQETSAKVVTEAIDPLGGVTLTGAASLYQAGLITRRDTLQYTTPSFNGLTATVQYYLGESTSGATTGGSVSEDNKGYALALNYSQGPLRAAAVAERIDRQGYYGTNANRLINLSAGSVVLPFDGGATSTTSNIIDNVDFNAAGASYNFGFATLHALSTKIKFKDAATTDNGSVKNTLLGVTIPLQGGVTLFGSISDGKISGHDSSANEQYDTSGYQLVARYDLSKRTNAYFAMGQTKFDSPAANRDVTIKQMGVGLRHSF